MHQSSSVSTHETPVYSLNNSQQVQVIKINGQLYAPVQQEHSFYEKKINKHVYKEAPPTNMMNQHVDSHSEYIYQDTLATPDNYHHLQNKAISTPKRNSEQLNRSYDQKKKKAKGEDTTQQQHQPNRHSPKIYTPSEGTNAKGMPTNNRATTTTAKPYVNKAYSIPVDHLRRAVGGNLPCFIIEFDSSIAPRNLPSAIIACDLIQEHFMKNNIVINRFSVALFIGHRLKLGVDNMQEYSNLVRTDKWPTSINGKKIQLIKPKYVPVCFSLVVHYIAHEISIQTVTDEIKRSINSADNFTEIMYSFNRPTKDVRFTVSDLAEYEGALKLGRLAVANRLHPITKYLPANKLTFCTNCWQVGHLRSSCKSNIRKCRICLEVFDRDHISKCSGNPLCAQCGLDHHSMDPNCEYIQKYRHKLNQEVKQAVIDGTISRRTIQLHQQQQAFPPGSTYDIDYPLLPGNNINNIKILENKT